MPLPHAGRSLLIARVRLLRRYRRLRASPAKFWLLLLASVPAILLLTSFVVVATYTGGRDISGASPATTERVARTIGSSLWGLVAFSAVYWAASGGLDVGADELLLVTAPLRDAVTGGIAMLYVVVLAVLSIPFFGGVLAFSLGSGILSVVPVSIGILAVLTASAHIVGTTVGLGIRMIATQMPLSERYRTILLWLPILGLFALQLTGMGDSVIEGVVTRIANTPVGLFGVGWLLPVRTDQIVPVLGVLVAGVCVVPVGITVSTGLVARTLPERGHSKTGGTSARFPGPLERFVDDKVATFAYRAWLQAIRRPRSLFYVPLPLLLAVEPFVRYHQTGTIPPGLPHLVGLYVAWAAGAAFSLNPIGGEGPALSQVLLSTPGRVVVLGRVLAGSLPAAPIAALFVSLAGFGARLPAQWIGVIVGVSVVLCVLTPLLAAGTGSLFPRFPTGRESVPPSRTAFVSYSFVLLLCASPMIVAPAVPISSAGGILGTLGLTSASAAVGSTIATRRVENYTFD